MNAVAVGALFFLWAAALSSGLRRGKTPETGNAQTSTMAPSTMAGRVLEKMLARVEASGVDISLSREVARETEEMLNSLTTSFPRVPTNSEESFCKAQETYNLVDFERDIHNSFTRAPFSCLRPPRRDIVSSVYGLFGESARATEKSRDPMLNLVANCVFQDLTERYGGSGGPWSDEGFDEWNSANLAKIPGLRTMVSEGSAQAKFYSNMAVTNASTSTSWMLYSQIKKLTGMYSQASSDSDKTFLREKAKKMYMIFFTLYLIAEVDAGREDLDEAMHMRRAVFYDNVEWAVNYEKLGVKLGSPGADPDNVKLGERLLKIYKSCYRFKIVQKPPQLRLVTRGDLAHKSVLLYTLWNSRYVHYFVGQDAQKSVCLQAGSSKWKHAPWAVLHTVVALGAPMNLNSPDLSDWGTYRIFALDIVGAGIRQSCEGNMAWVPRI